MPGFTLVIFVLLLIAVVVGLSMLNKSRIKTRPNPSSNIVKRAPGERPEEERLNDPLVHEDRPGRTATGERIDHTGQTDRTDRIDRSA